MEEKVEKKIYLYSDADAVLKEILASEVNESGRLKYPAHIGAAGLLESTDGTDSYIVFDNQASDCLMDKFKTYGCCMLWFDDSGLSSDRIHQLDEDLLFLKHHDYSFVESIEFNKRSISPDISLSFDKNGIYETYMRFEDGIAVECQADGSSISGREPLQLCYPSVDCLIQFKELCHEVSSFTGRNWYEGSVKEKVFDSALRYGELLNKPVG